MAHGAWKPVLTSVSHGHKGEGLYSAAENIKEKTISQIRLNKICNIMMYALVTKA